MKAYIKLTAGIIVAAITVLDASRSASSLTIKPKQPKTTQVGFYSTEDVEFLMKTNRWTKSEATRFLDFCQNGAEVEHLSKMKL